MGYGPTDSTATASEQEITEKGKRGTTRYTTYFELMLNIKNSNKVWSFYNSHFMYTVRVRVNGLLDCSPPFPYNGND